MNQELLDVLESIKGMRTRLHRLQNSVSNSHIKVLSQLGKRKNCELIHSKITTLAVVHQTQPTIQLLLQTSDYIGVSLPCRSSTGTSGLGLS